jgi:TRAP-type mannitol/chloroaromatic compound transport system permease small subunit
LVPLLIAGVGVHLVFSMNGPVWFFFDVFLVLFALVLAVKRCLDRHKPGWFLGLGLAPIAWLVALLDPKLVRELDMTNQDTWIALAVVSAGLTVWVGVELFFLAGRATAREGLAEITLPGGIDAFVEGVGRVAAWICIAQVLLVGNNVILRYMFRIGPVSLQELEWHMLSPIALIGMCYALNKKDHVRVDIFYDKFSHRTKQLVEMLTAVIGIVIALLIVDLAMDFVARAYAVDEGSPDPGGLPHRWLLRSFIPIGFLIFALQSFGNLLKVDWSALRWRAMTT